MSYRLQGDETVQDGLRRCAREQLDRAIGELTYSVHDDPVEAVHDARKALKKSRSLLRLGRGTLNGDGRRRENATLRHAGCLLSSARDAEVMLEAVDDLADRYAGRVPQATFGAIRRHLEAERDPARRRLLESGLTDQVAEELKAVRSRDRRLAAATGRLEGARARPRTRLRPRPRRARTGPSPGDHREPPRLAQAHQGPPVPPSDAEAGLARNRRRRRQGGRRAVQAPRRRPRPGRPTRVPGERRPAGPRPRRRARAHRPSPRATPGSGHPAREAPVRRAPKVFVRRMHRYWKAWRAERSPALARAA